MKNVRHCTALYCGRMHLQTRYASLRLVMISSAHHQKQVKSGWKSVFSTCSYIFTLTGLFKIKISGCTFTKIVWKRDFEKIHDREVNAVSFKKNSNKLNILANTWFSWILTMLWIFYQFTMVLNIQVLNAIKQLKFSSFRISFRLIFWKLLLFVHICRFPFSPKTQNLFLNF